MVTTVQWDRSESVLAHPNDDVLRGPDFDWGGVMQTAVRTMWLMANYGILLDHIHVFDHSARI